MAANLRSEKVAHTFYPFGENDMRPIDGFTDYYITRDGKVWSFKGRAPRILKPGRSPKGTRYQQVQLMQGKYAKRVYVHHLVYKTFVGDVPQGQMIRHWNDDPLDNRVENLVAGTAADNNRDAMRNKRLLTGEDCSWSLLTNQQALEVKAQLQSGRSIKWVAEDLGIDRSIVENIYHNLAYRYVGEPVTTQVEHATGYQRSSSNNKLSAKAIQEIRDLLKTGLSYAEIAKQFEVSASAIQGIKEGRLGKWVP